jgi:hypothetical protein
MASRMRVRGRTLLVAGALGTSLLATAIATAVPPGRSTTTSHISQQLISRSLDGGGPNAPATETTISWDARVARYLAYTSAATNISAGSGGHRNVYLVTRSGGTSGSPWTYGSTTLASRGAGGAAANGDSFSPALGGWAQADSARRPKCLAFVSQASNLVSGDTNGQADVFVRSLPGGATRRLAAPADKPASEVAVSGDCHTIAVVAGGSLFVKRGGSGLKKVTGAGVRSPHVTFNGASIGYAKGGGVYVRGRSGGAHRVASGTDPTGDGGKPSNPRRGKLRSVAYESGGVIYYKDVGGQNRMVSAGTAAHPTNGGGQVLFGSGPYVYLYATSNNFGKGRPQGYCPPGQGNVTSIRPSARGNYVVFSCSGGRAYLSYLGGK